MKTVSKINKIEYIRIEDQEGLLINGPQMQKFILILIPIVQLWALENKTAIDISDQKLKKVLCKLKTEQQLLNKIE